MREDERTFEFTLAPLYADTSLLSKLAGTADNYTLTFSNSQEEEKEENDCTNYDCKYYDCAPSCYDDINSQSRCKDCCLNKEGRNQMADNTINIPVEVDMKSVEAKIERMGQRVTQLQKEIQKAYDMLEDLDSRSEDLSLVPKFYGNIYNNCSFNYGKHGVAHAWNNSDEEVEFGEIEGEE